MAIEAARGPKSGPKEYRIFGPPLSGTGKTTDQARQIGAAVVAKGSDRVLAVSFTKAAAVALAGHNLPLDSGNVGTLHAICYRALGRPPIAETRVKDWNAAHPADRLTDASASVDDTYGERPLDEPGDSVYGQYTLLRAKLTPRELWPLAVRAFAGHWETWKAAEGMVDFTDMIEIVHREYGAAPGRPAVIFADEVQDFTPLEFATIKKWGEHAEYIVLSGDDDQCQPPGTRVLVTGGEMVAIEDLDPVRHTLVSYDRAASSVAGLRRGYAFEKSWRSYSGWMLGVTAGGQRTRCTPDHRWLARWTDAAKSPDVSVVYLMRQGRRYRIGWCRLFNSERALHLGARARLEKADGAWILRVCRSRTEASVYESFYATKYGIPTGLFEPSDIAQHFTREAIDQLYGLLGPMNLNAFRLCSDLNLDDERPLWTPARAYERQGGSALMTVEACNLIPGLMAVPVWTGGRSVEWHSVAIDREFYSGVVYSLAVEPHRLYIADNIVTHNCVYAWKGASPETFLAEGESQIDRVLEQSFRVPRTIHALAQRWIEQLGARRHAKVYKPRDAEGEVRQLPGATYKYPEPLIAAVEREVAQNRSVMILATCSYMLARTISLLREAGIPFANRYRPARGDWNPLHVGRGVSTADRLLAFLTANTEASGEQARLWTPPELRQWTDLLRSEGSLKRGAKTAIAALPGGEPITDLDALLELFEVPALTAAIGERLEPALAWLESAALTEKRRALKFPATVIRRRGVAALEAEPLVTVGTYHAVKGGEAETVFLFPDLSPAADSEWSRPGPGRDSIRRTVYVGLTRASERLVLCGAATPCAWRT